MIIKKEGHIHKWGNQVFSKLVPVRRGFIEDGKRRLDTITAKDTIYFRKCEGKDCRETQSFHMSRRLQGDSEDVRQSLSGVKGQSKSKK